MSIPERYQVLFEPVEIGPVTAPNRFYQVPHCTGLGWVRPRMLAELRGVKAEGGWGVVCTEYCSIHPSSDDLPFPYASLWDDGDIRSHALMTEKVHAHGALAGVELWAGGTRSSNSFTREVPRAPASMGAGNVFSVLGAFPKQARAMDRQDIRNLRKWHRDAALRAREAGFDVVYVYAAHGYLLSQFLNPEINQRNDEYGGSVENRGRLVRELIEETRDAVGDRCAVACRYAVNDSIAEDGSPVFGDRREIFESLADLPDLWDITVSSYSLEMGVSRFTQEASLEPFMDFVKSVTTKPVVTVGRFTSPDTMASQVRRGVVDFIGAARPSIADPFLPAKIREDRWDEIRECIGCNICYAADGLGVPIRCTQNPTMGEEWRRGWHPENVPASASPGAVLVVGGGPAGLEAARVAGKAGHRVMLAEATRELGGRINLESALPGLSEWARVRDYRVQQLEKMPNVEIFRESRLTAADVLELAPNHVAIATGSSWRTDGFGRHNETVISGLADSERVIAPERAIQETLPPGSYLVYDDDHYVMASALAEKLATAGHAVSYTHLTLPTTSRV